MLKRRSFRFNLRRLMVFATVACLYFACWTPTKTMGTGAVERRYRWIHNLGGAVANATPVAPLLLSVRIDRYQGPKGRTVRLPTEHVYCFWFFGVVVEAPI